MGKLRSKRLPDLLDNFNFQNFRTLFLNKNDSPPPPFTWIFVKLFMACVSSKVVRSSSIMQNLSLVFGHTSFPWYRCWSHGVLYVQITEGSAKMMKKRAFHLPPQKGPTIHVCHSTTKLYTKSFALCCPYYKNTNRCPQQAAFYRVQTYMPPSSRPKPCLPTQHYDQRHGEPRQTN